MSAPKTDVEKQEKQHRGPLRGMAGVVGFALFLLVILVIWISFNGNEPEGAETQIDGRTGIEEPAAIE
ncbi:hypothetical protein ACOI1H_20860 [Loktanella sp. DJP18]|uniref:hypothetical protein n=1 Tax=Loktanella sp. DJP18 TaxID=3409788 RepID=UPI003BB79CFD